MDEEISRRSSDSKTQERYLEQPLHQKYIYTNSHYLYPPQNPQNNESSNFYPNKKNDGSENNTQFNLNGNSKEFIPKFIYNEEKKDDI